jgi:hypothetical protein
VHNIGEDVRGWGHAERHADIAIAVASMREAEEERKRMGDADVMLGIFDIERDSKRARLEDLEEKTMILHSKVREEEMEVES